MEISENRIWLSPKRRLPLLRLRAGGRKVASTSQVPSRPAAGTVNPCGAANHVRLALFGTYIQIVPPPENIPGHGQLAHARTCRGRSAEGKNMRGVRDTQMYLGSVLLFLPQFPSGRSPAFRSRLTTAEQTRDIPFPYSDVALHAHACKNLLHCIRMLTRP